MDASLQGIPTTVAIAPAGRGSLVIRSTFSGSQCEFHMCIECSLTLILTKAEARRFIRWLPFGTVTELRDRAYIVTVGLQVDSAWRGRFVTDWIGV